MVTFWIVFLALAFSTGAWLAVNFADAINKIRELHHEY